ncbi:hypothetical protein GOV13_04650 [Candidatus Pacearchaeota archaeon]|nr:hypothetical protein [Candidatus Pacearchaeota archaeon]
MIKISHYDEDTDSLIISRIEDNEKVRKSFILGDFVISTTGRGKIVSLEIRDVSGFFDEIGFDVDKIKNSFGDLSLIVKPKKDILFIGLGLGNNSMIKQIPIANIPVQCIGS